MKSGRIRPHLHADWLPLSVLCGLAPQPVVLGVPGPDRAEQGGAVAHAAAHIHDGAGRRVRARALACTQGLVAALAWMVRILCMSCKDANCAPCGNLPSLRPQAGLHDDPAARQARANRRAGAGGRCAGCARIACHPASEGDGGGRCSLTPAAAAGLAAGALAVPCPPFARTCAPPPPAMPCLQRWLLWL